MSKQNTITAKQMNKGWNAVVAQTHTLNQVLKSFGGLMRTKLEELDGLTVGAFLAANGIEVVRGKVGVSAIRNAWHADMMKDNAMCVFRNQVGVWTPEKGDDLWEKNTRGFRVCSKAEAEKYVKSGECEFISVYGLVAVGDCKWDTKVIANAMKQKATFTKCNERAVKAELDWETLEEAYIVYDIKDGDNITRKMRRVAKNEVKF